MAKFVIDRCRFLLFIFHKKKKSQFSDKFISVYEMWLFWLVPLIVIILVLFTFIINYKFNIDKHCYVLSEKHFSEQEWRAFKIFITYKLYLKRDGVVWYMYIHVHMYMCYIAMTWYMTFYTCSLPYVTLPDLQYCVL